MRTLLLAEDDPLVVALLLGILDGADLEIVEVDSGTEALRQLATRSFDCVVSDLKMPGCTGLEVLARARELSPTAELVLISGYADEENEAQARQIGATLMHKPFGVKQFREALGL